MQGLGGIGKAEGFADDGWPISGKLALVPATGTCKILKRGQHQVAIRAEQD